jgi:hypothetical protein
MINQNLSKDCPNCGEPVKPECRRTTLKELTSGKKQPPAIVVYRCRCGVTFSETEDPEASEAAEPARWRATA